MISICIPIYNYDCSRLIHQLVDQINLEQLEAEINLMDDCSDQRFQDLLQPLAKKINFYQLTENVGRSKIRNLLAEKARFPYLLFIDGDSEIIEDTFLKKYVDFLKKNQGVQLVCGGSIYSDIKPEQKYRLRWKYSKKREGGNSKFQHKPFTTNNFLIGKALFSTIKFNEKISNYGHEDTLFGFELSQQNIEMKVIPNPVLNGDLDEYSQFIRKTKKGLKNLILILKLIDNKQDFVKSVGILRIYFRLRETGLNFLLVWCRGVFGFDAEDPFSTNNPPLWLFDLYRISMLDKYYELNKKAKKGSSSQAQ